MEKYIEHALVRRDRVELMNALEGMTLEELNIMFGVVAACDDSVSKIDSLAALADYANLKTTSVEKRALIRPFINKHTSF